MEGERMFYLVLTDRDVSSAVNWAVNKSTHKAINKQTIGIHHPSIRLQLNPSITELIRFGSWANLQKIATENLALQVGEDIIQPVKTVRDLGVTLDTELSMQRHVNKVASIWCFHHIRRLKQVRHLLERDVTLKLVSAFILNRLDYCNAVLAGLTQPMIAPLQREQNVATRLVTGIGFRESVTPTLQQLRWLPVQYRITFKLCLLIHKIHHPTSLINLLQMPTCNPAQDCVLPVPGNIRYQLY